MESTIAAIATSPGESGIGIIRISGEESLNILNKIFYPASKNLEPKDNHRQLIYGHIKDEQGHMDCLHHPGILAHPHAGGQCAQGQGQRQ